MKKATLYTLDVSMIQELNRKIPRGERSAFVNKAIRTRLDGEDDYSIDDVPLKKLIQQIRFIHWSELTKLEMAMIDSVLERLL